MQTHGPNIWVVRRGRGFSIVEEGTDLYLVPALKQPLAVTLARLLARANGSELVVQSHRGRIVFRDGIGIDSGGADG